MSEENRSSADHAFERRTRELFDASVAGLDAQSRSRLNHSRQHALEIATGDRRVVGVWKTGFAAGVVAASVLVVALLWRGPDPAVAPGLDAQVGAVEATSPALEMLAANEEELQLAAAEEELEFYAWVEAVAAATGGAGES